MLTHLASSLPEPLAEDDCLDIADILAVATNDFSRSYRTRTWADDNDEI